MRDKFLLHDHLQTFIMQNDDVIDGA